MTQNRSRNTSKQCGVPRWKSKKLAVTQLQTVSPFAPGTAQPCKKEGWASLNNLSFSSILLVPDDYILQERITTWFREDSLLVLPFSDVLCCWTTRANNAVFWGHSFRVPPKLWVTYPWIGGMYRCKTQVHSVSIAGLLSWLPARYFLKLLGSTQVTQRKTKITRNKGTLC